MAITIGAVVLLLVGITAAVVVRTRHTPSVRAGVDAATLVRGAAAALGDRRFRAAFSFASGSPAQVRSSQVGTIDRAAGRADVAVQSPSTRTFRAVVAGPDLYIRAGQPLGGRPWAVVALTDAGTLVGGIGGVGATGLIGAMLDQPAALKNVRDVAVEEVDGIAVRHLHATVPVTDLVGLGDRFRSLGVSGEAGVDVFVAADGTPRRITVSAKADAATVVAALNVQQIGTAAAVEVPLPADVARVGLREIAQALRA